MQTGEQQNVKLGDLLPLLTGKQPTVKPEDILLLLD